MANEKKEKEVLSDTGGIENGKKAKDGDIGKETSVEIKSNSEKIKNGKDVESTDEKKESVVRKESNSESKGNVNSKSGQSKKAPKKKTSKKKSALKVHSPESNASNVKKKKSVEAETAEEQQVPGKSVNVKAASPWTGKAALVIAIIALFIALQERMSTQKDAVKSLNSMITKAVVPKLKKTAERGMVNSIYDLKRVSITLDEMNENIKNEEIKALVTRIRKDIDDLSVKFLVHE